MKFLLVSNMYPAIKSPSYGVFVRNIVDKLSEHEKISFDKAVISGKPTGILSKALSYLFFYIKAFILGFLGKYDFIYIHYISHSSLPILLLNLFNKKKIIINIHGGDVLQHDDVSNLAFKFKRYISKKVIDVADLIVVPSLSYSRLVIEQYGASKDNIVVYASGGINTNLFSPKKNFAKNKKLTLGYVGRLEPVKGVHLLTRVAKKLKDEGIDFHLSITGNGSLKESLLSEINRENLESYISYQEQKIQSELPDLYRSFDVLIFPSKAESLGLVGLEAMACGCPVLGSNIDGIKNYLQPEYNGLIFREGDVNDLFEKILLIKSLSSTELQTISENSVKTASQFESSKQTEILINSLIECCNRDK